MKAGVFTRWHLRPVIWGLVWRLEVIAANLPCIWEAPAEKTTGILFSIDHHRGSEEQQPGEEYFDPDLFDPQTGRVDTFREFRTTIERAGIEDTVVPIVSRSEVAARQWATPLSLVFIDGGHAFETVFARLQRLGRAYYGGRLSADS